VALHYGSAICLCVTVIFVGAIATALWKWPRA
jgi:hypothetical protein